MQDLNRNKRDDMTFEQMDATHMSYPDEKFNVVLDKGTLDALAPDNSKETGKTVDTYFTVSFSTKPSTVLKFNS